MELQHIYKQFQYDLEVVEEELLKAVQSECLPIYQSMVDLLTSGGKRLRPILVLLSGKFGQYDIHRLKKVAVAMELIHMATLVHDDVIDDAKTRRGKKTVKATWDNLVAMYTGDFILAKAVYRITEIKDPQIHQIFSKVMVQMCQGEIQQVKELYILNQSLKDYLQRIKRKTALLMAISCQLGALISQTDGHIARKLYLYGYYIGMAFQLTDDVLDITSYEKLLGKPAGNDLRQGNVTLPVIYTLSYASIEEKDQITTYIKTQGEEGFISDILYIVKKTGGTQFTLSLAYRYLKKATAILNTFPNSDKKDSLQRIAKLMQERLY